MSTYSRKEHNEFLVSLEDFERVAGQVCTARRALPNKEDIYTSQWVDYNGATAVAIRYEIQYEVGNFVLLDYELEELLERRIPGTLKTIKSSRQDYPLDDFYEDCHP